MCLARLRSDFPQHHKETGLSTSNNLTVALGHGLIRCCGTEPNEKQLAVGLTVCLRKIDGQSMVTHEHQTKPGTLT
jgi:hypothetical protein